MTMHRDLGIVISTLSIIVTILVSDSFQRQYFQNISRQQHTLDQFPNSRVDIGREERSIDLDAKSILEGGGPQQWRATGKEAIGKKRVFFIDEGRWVSHLAFPKGGRADADIEEVCNVSPPGKLRVIGFSNERKAALVQYETQGETGGTRCESGIYLFYPLP